MSSKTQSLSFLALFSFRDGLMINKVMFIHVVLSFKK